MIQPYDLPERLMGADPDFFIAKKLAKTEQGLSFFDPEALAEYMRYFRNPATIHAMCEDYRATFGVDLDMDTKDFDAGRKIDLPGAAAVGRDRRRRPQSQGRGDLAALRDRHPRRQGAALRALSLRGSAGGDLSGAARVLPRTVTHCASARDRRRRAEEILHRVPQQRRFLLKPGLCAVFGRMTN